MYKYLTVQIPFGFRRTSLKEKIQEVLDEKSKDGWRLSKFECSEAMAICILIFEKEM